MAQLIGFVLALCWAAPALSLTLEPRLVATLPGTTRFQNTRVGGLSALVFSGEKLFLLSDDRGRNGSSRFYEADLKIRADKAEVIPRRVHIMKGLPGLKEFKTSLDPEGLVRLPQGDFLVSSEANTNHKPRDLNRLLQVSADGRFLGEIALPEDVQPEAVGRQRKGTHNNAGPEGLSLTPKGDFLWVGYERALLQEREPRVVRLDRYHRDAKGNFVFERSHRYRMADPPFGKIEVIRGVSEVLALDENHLLVIERTGNLLSSFTLGYGGGLYLADCSNEVCTKQPVLDFEGDLKKIRGGKPVPNFEGLSWGPSWADGSASLLLLSDNNFMKDDDTEIIVFSVKDRP